VAIFAPAGTPPDVVGQAHRPIKQALEQPETKTRAAAAGIELRLPAAGRAGRAGEARDRVLGQDDQGRGHHGRIAWADVSRDDAAAIAQRTSNGRVLAVERADAGGRPVWRVKVVTPRGDVRVILVDVGHRPHVLRPPHAPAADRGRHRPAPGLAPAGGRGLPRRRSRRRRGRPVPRAEYPFDLAIVDLGLPKLNGLTIVQRLRAEGRAMPVLILTARSSWQDKVTGLEAGADDYLVKPFEYPSWRRA
jgi:CheY-like chemotaxis protein